MPSRTLLIRSSFVIAGLGLAIASRGQQRPAFAAIQPKPAETSPVAVSPRLSIPEYRIEPGDVLAIEVWKEPDLSNPSVPVRLDGNIALPMLGQTPAAGLAPADLERILADKYAEYVRKPRVTVLLKEVNSQRAYVIGEVKKEGFVRLTSRLTVLQALAECGGLTDFASRGKIQILRSEGSREVILPFDYSAVIKGKKREQNIILLPGDTVVVPR